MAELEQVEGDVDLMTQAGTGVENSQALQTVVHFILMMGNYLNDGTNKGGVRAFSLESLLALKDVDSFAEKNFSLLNFLCLNLEQACPSAFQILDDLEHCAAASRVDVEEAKRKSADILKSLDFVKEVSERSEGRFGDEMKAFVASAKSSIDRLA